MSIQIIQKDKNLFLKNSQKESKERDENLFFLIKETVKRFNIVKDFEVKINTGNRYLGKYSISVTEKMYQDGFPSYIFYKWSERNIPDYEILCSSFENKFPSTNKIGWIGSIFGNSRNNFFEISKTLSFVESIESNIIYNGQAKVYLNFQEQIDKWKYLIDLEGFGFSARVPILLRSPRIIFLVDRTYKEWYYELLEPWVHYIPVKSDFSDLQNNYEVLERDKKLQSFISSNQKEFAKKYLTRDAALLKIAQIINNQT